MTSELASILSAFRLDAGVISCERYGCGHINVTYLVVTESPPLHSAEDQ